MSSSVSVRVAPSPRCLFDEPVCISVGGLRPQQEVTLRASLTDETGVRFQSRARYRAGAGGELDLTRSPSLGGSFTGLEPMGLLWALESDTPHRRLVKRDVQTPFHLELEVHEGHGEDPPGELLGRGTHERGFLREGVQRTPVRDGRVRGTLFQPPGHGPFPGIIDIYGTGGGLPEYRASLLANHGFATLALAYYGYEDLPKQMKEFSLEYFEEAVNYMLQHPQMGEHQPLCQHGSLPLRGWGLKRKSRNPSESSMALSSSELDEEIWVGPHTTRDTKVPGFVGKETTQVTH